MTLDEQITALLGAEKERIEKYIKQCCEQAELRDTTALNKDFKALFESDCEAKFVASGVDRENYSTHIRFVYKGETYFICTDLMLAPTPDWRPLEARDYIERPSYKVFKHKICFKNKLGEFFQGDRAMDELLITLGGRS